MTTSLATYTQTAGSTLGRGIDFAGILSSSAPLGTDSLVSATWSVVSGGGSVTASTINGTVAAALFTAGPSGSPTVFKVVATTTKGQLPAEYLTITGA